MIWCISLQDRHGTTREVAKAHAKFGSEYTHSGHSTLVSLTQLENHVDLTQVCRVCDSLDVAESESRDSTTFKWSSVHGFAESDGGLLVVESDVRMTLWRYTGTARLNMLLQQ